MATYFLRTRSAFSISKFFFFCVEAAEIALKSFEYFEIGASAGSRFRISFPSINLPNFPKTAHKTPKKINYLFTKKISRLSRVGVDFKKIFCEFRQSSFSATEGEFF